MEEEATPTLRPVPGIDLGEYRETLIARFSNPAIRDTLARLAFDGSERMTKWLLPVIRENLAAGGEIRRSAAVVAGWARYCEGVDEQGQPIDVADHRRDRLMANARRQREDPLAFVADRDLFGDLVDDERFTSPLPGDAGLPARAWSASHPRGSGGRGLGEQDRHRRLTDGLPTGRTDDGRPAVEVVVARPRRQWPGHGTG